MVARARVAVHDESGDLRVESGTPGGASGAPRRTAQSDERLGIRTARHRVELIIERVYAAQTDMCAVRTAIHALLAEPQLVDSGNVEAHVSS